MPPRFGIQAPKCPTCSTSVYAAERVVGPAGRDYHKQCLKCLVCGKRLDSTLLVEHDGQPFCRNCHKEHLGQGKGGFATAVPLKASVPLSPARGTFAAAPLSSHSTGGSSSNASRRTAAVAPDDIDSSLAEEVTGIRISARQGTDRRDFEPSIPSISARAAPSPSASSSAQQATPTTMRTLDQAIASGIPYEEPELERAPAPATPEPAREVPRPTYRSAAYATGGGSAAPSSPSVAHAPKVVGPKPAVPSSSSVDASPQRPVPSSSSSSSALPPPQRQTPSRVAGGIHIASPSASTPPSQPPSTTPGYLSGRSAAHSPSSGLSRLGLSSSVASAASGTPLCARCNRAVYFAEQKQAAGRKWHRACLRCDGCRTTLESGKLEEGPPSAAYDTNVDGEQSCNVFCKPCYAKRFGPKGINSAGISLPEHQ